MAKILIYTNVEEIEYALFEKSDYKDLYKIIKSERGGNWPNFANRLWLQGLVSEIQSSDNELYFDAEKYSAEEINELFDIVILSCANIFAITYKSLMEHYVEFFSKIHKPVYVISCGVQANDYSQLDELVDNIGEVSKRFIDSIYKTGGEFSLRGYFTKEFFDRITRNTAKVTGCPSLYQVGKNLTINKKNILREDLKPVVNGQNFMLSTKFYKKIFDEYKQAVFVDQDHYGVYLYDPEMQDLDSMSFTSMLKLVKKEGYLGLKLASENRLLYFADMPQWRDVLISEKFNFSFGARIHGNIMSILSGIPGVVHAWDIRTQEMADFFDIPFVNTTDLAGKDLFDIYENIDFTKFNKTFSSKYEAYEEFLRECKIVNKVNAENIFFYDKKLKDPNRPFINNKEKLIKLSEELNKAKTIYQFEDFAFLKYREIMKKQYSMK